MSVAVKAETPKGAARRLAARPLSRGFKLVSLHRYDSESGEPFMWRIRLKDPRTGEKWIRPMWLGPNGYQLEEPPAPAGGKPLYQLGQLRAGDPENIVFLVEGETCADALAQLGVLATTSGGAGSADGADWTPLRGRTVAIWPDNDAPGRKYAEVAGTHLRALDCRVEVVEIAQLKLPEHGDVVDFLMMRRDTTCADILSLTRVAQAPKGRDLEGWAPEPLRRLMPAPDPYPIDALGTVLAPAAQQIRNVVQCPAAIAGQSILAAASLAVQAHADVVVDGRREPLSIWSLTIAESGERKSSADSWALREHRSFERALAEKYRYESSNYEIQKKAHEAAVRQAEKQRAAKDIRASLEALGEAPEPPMPPLILVAEPTLEGLHKLFQRGRPSLGLFNADAGDFLGGHAMNRDNRMKSAAGLSKLWDDGTFCRVRSTDGAGKYYGRRLAVSLMVQPVLAKRVLNDEILCGQGFLSRFLLAWPESTIGSRHYVERDLCEDTDLIRYWEVMRDRLAKPPRQRQGTHQELDPRGLPLNPVAKAYWIDATNAIEEDMRNEYSQIRPWANKAGSQILRVAGVLTLVEDFQAKLISPESIESAARLVHYHLREAARLVDTASIPKEIQDAEALFEWCRDRGKQYLYSTDALRNGPNRLRAVEPFERAAEVLESHGWAEKVKDGMKLDGRKRKKVWRVWIQAEE